MKDKQLRQALSVGTDEYGDLEVHAITRVERMIKNLGKALGYDVHYNGEVDKRSKN